MATETSNEPITESAVKEPAPTKAVAKKRIAKTKAPKKPVAKPAAKKYPPKKPAKKKRIAKKPAAKKSRFIKPSFTRMFHTTYEISTYRECRRVDHLRLWRGTECERACLSGGQLNGFLFAYGLAVADKFGSHSKPIDGSRLKTTR
jgi:hypothetical protein